MSSRAQLTRAFHGIMSTLGVPDLGPSYNMDTYPKEVAEKLGRQFFDYMVASIYDMNWEGYLEEELEGVAAFIVDLERSVKATEKS